MAARKRENAQRPPKAGASAGARNAASMLDGRGGLDGVTVFSREQVIEVQRARILTAMTQVACERGAQSATVAHVVERCGVSRRTFYEIFDDRDDCFLAAFEDAVARATARVAPAYELTPGRWRERVRAGLVELLVFCEQEPLLARVALVESLAGAPAVLARRAEIQEVLVAAIEQGGEEASSGASIGPLVAEGVIGGVSSVLAARLSAAGEQPDLLGLTGPLMSMIVLPYLGAAAARREASAPAPVRSADERPERDGAIELSELGMRLTYRTLRVLMAVAERSGGSNRLIGQTAGIHDQGQISKLLARLQRVGLVKNTGAEAGKGMPNAWSLTEKGTRIADGVRAHATEESN